ncbi:hypothetical protein ES702_03577 [subsurface metagenome]
MDGEHTGQFGQSKARRRQVEAVQVGPQERWIGNGRPLHPCAVAVAVAVASAPGALDDARLPSLSLQPRMSPSSDFAQLIH